MGNAYGNAQNIAVRVFLTQFSKKFKTFFDKHYKQKTLEYFDNKCPYSGVSISNIETNNEHIRPINKEDCGLHLYGNVLIVTKEANANKHNQSLEDFLCDDPKKLQKIQNFMKEESGFHDIYTKHHEQLKERCNSLYTTIRTTIETDLNDFIAKYLT